MHARSWIVALIVLVMATVAAGCGASRENLNVGEDQLLGGAAAGDFAQKVADGDALWAQREDRAKLEAAIATWEEALTLQSADADEAARRDAVYTVYVKIAQANYFLADGYIRFDAEDPDDVAEPMKAGYDKGARAAEMALYVYSPEYQEAVTKKGTPREDAIPTLDKGAAPALYWYASNLSKWALLIGLGETLGHVDTLFAVATFVEEKDPTFWYHAAYRYFGGYYTKLPFPGGDKKKAQAYFEKGVAASPTYLGTPVLYAEMLAVKLDDEALYRSLLQKVLDTPDDIDPAIIAENKVEKRKAQRLMDNIDDHF